MVKEVYPYKMTVTLLRKEEEKMGNECSKAE